MHVAVSCVVVTNRQKTPLCLDVFEVGALPWAHFNHSKLHKWQMPVLTLPTKHLYGVIQV